MANLASARTTKSRSIDPEIVENSFYYALRFAEILECARLNGESLAITDPTIMARPIRPGSDRETYLLIKHNSPLA